MNRSGDTRRREVLSGLLLAGMGMIPAHVGFAREAKKIPRIGYLGTNIGDNCVVGGPVVPASRWYHHCPFAKIARRAVSSSLPGLLVWIDHLTRLVLRRCYHDLGREVSELADVVALDVLELHLEHARLRPFTQGPERHVADDGKTKRAAAGPNS